MAEVTIVSIECSGSATPGVVVGCGVERGRHNSGWNEAENSRGLKRCLATTQQPQLTGPHGGITQCECDVDVEGGLI